MKPKTMEPFARALENITKLDEKTCEQHRKEAMWSMMLSQKWAKSITDIANQANIRLMPVSFVFRDLVSRQMNGKEPAKVSIVGYNSGSEYRHPVLSFTIQSNGQIRASADLDGFPLFVAVDDEDYESKLAEVLATYTEACLRKRRH